MKNSDTPAQVVGGAANFKSTSEPDQRSSTMEKIFLAPPFTEELIAAIKLIAPHLSLRTDENSRSAWEADQNGSCWGEYEALAPLLHSISRPAKILEIGPGMGRSLVFFNKILDWKDCEMHAYEGEGKNTKYTLLGPRFNDSFCGNIRMLKYILDYNEVHNVTIFDAKDSRLVDLPGPYNFIYSFYSIGYHWSLAHFLDDILSLLQEDSIAVFIVPGAFTVFPALKELSYYTVSLKSVWEENSHLQLLVIRKNRSRPTNPFTE
jgi:SAM-dependent methyltransferase